MGGPGRTGQRRGRDTIRACPASARSRSLLTTDSIERRLLTPPPRDLTDDAPGPPLRLDGPIRPANLEPVGARAARVPSLAGFANPRHRARILHAFANHELQATELYAWAILAFPDAPPELRRDLLSVLVDEQRHTRMYIARVEACGARFGEFPVSDYFWAKAPSLTTPLRFLCAMALTWENANLDHTLDSAAAARAAGDDASAAVIDKVQSDEVRHVSIGWKWLARLKPPDMDMWTAWRANIDFPLRPALARGRRFNAAGRVAAGLDEAFIAALEATDLDLDRRGAALDPLRSGAARTDDAADDPPGAAVPSRP
ncbi:MAG: DUF455 family protein [Anaerolineae bacterium]